MNSLTAPLAARVHSRYLEIQSQIEDRRAALEAQPDEGAATVEYVGGTIAALAMAAILIGLVKGGFVPKFMASFLEKQLSKYLTV